MVVGHFVVFEDVTEAEADVNVTVFAVLPPYASSFAARS